MASPRGSFKNILAAIDPEDTLAPTVLRTAHGEAAAHGAKLSVVSVLNIAPVVYPGAQATAFAAYEAAAPTKEDVREAEHKLRDLVQREAPGASCETIRGKTSDAVLDRSDELNADLIVMGTHQKQFWEKLILGSTSTDVSHRSKAAVLLVPPSSAG